MNRGQWPAGANDAPAKPLASPTRRAKNAADARRPIQTSKPPKGGK